MGGSSDVGAIDSWDDLVEFGELARKQLGRSTWFRGHADSSWSLVPAVFRTERVDGRHEAQLVRQFRAGARRRHADCPDDQDHFGWLSLMRHYGVPTRLLDWTETLLVAAFFATDENPGWSQAEGRSSVSASVGAMIALNPSTLAEQHDHPEWRVGPHSDVQTYPIGELAGDAFKGRVSDDFGAIEPVVPRETSLRMLVQRARFTIHGTSRPLDEHPKRSSFLLRCQLSVRGKEVIRKGLRELGVVKSSLFPDLEHFAEFLAESSFSAASPTTPGPK